MAKKKKTFSDFVERMLLPVLLGIASGISGGMIAYSYFTISLYEAPTALSVGRVASAVTTPLPETEIAKRIEAIDLPVFRTNTIGAGELANRAMRREEAVGMATVLTSDGWLMTDESVLTGNVVVGVDGALKAPTKTVVDGRTGVVFLKIENGPLQVADFEETETLGQGTPLYVLDGERGFVATSFGGAHLKDTLAVADADAFNRVFILQDELAASSRGGAVLTIGGNLAGIVTSRGFMPMHLLRPILSDVFRGQALDRGELGVRYLDLSVSYISGTAAETKTGARVTGSRVRGLSAVRSGSAASEAGLLEGDVILRVEGIELNGQRDLAESIAEYHSGDRVEMDILRKGERQIVQVELQ